MLFQSLISQALERGLRLGERSLPALVGGELLKDGRRKLFLLTVGEAGGGLECFPQGFGHGCDPAVDGTKSRSTSSTPTVNICAELLLDCNAVICHVMQASNSGCEHLYLDGARASAWRFSLLDLGHLLLDAGSSTMRLCRPSATTRS